MPTLSTTTSGFEVEPPGDQPASSTADTTNSNSSGNSSQTVSSNPSLILAFLALSFFTMAMVFIFGFRRYQSLQDRLHGVFGRAPAGGRGSPGSWQSLGVQQRQQLLAVEEMMRLRRLSDCKPRLWDVRCTDTTTTTTTRWWEVKGKAAAGGDSSDGLWRWEDVMPLSASKVTNSDGPGIVPASSRSPDPAPSLFRQFWRLRAPPPPSNGKDLMGSLPMPRLRLAFLVAMPSERYPIYEREVREDKSRHERGTLGCELGLYELPWDYDDDVIDT